LFPQADPDYIQECIATFYPATNDINRIVSDVSISLTETEYPKQRKNTLKAQTHELLGLVGKILPRTIEQGVFEMELDWYFFVILSWN
jgi:hypothetical protein